MTQKNSEVIEIFVLDISLHGGVERFACNLANGLSELGNHVKIISCHKSGSSVLYKTSKNVTIQYLTKFRFRPFFYKLTTLIACASYMLVHRKAKNIVIGTSPIINIYLSFLSRKICNFLIASEHSTYDAHGALVKFLRIASYRKLRAVVTQTLDGVTRFRSNNIPAIQIQNGVTDFGDHYQWTIQEQKAANNPILLTIARFEPVKQLEHYIKVAQLVSRKEPNAIFYLIGSGPEEFVIRKKIETLNLTCTIRVLKPTHGVNAFYSKADFYLITSSSEAFPMTMLEALSYGVPVISYDNLVGPKEIIENGKNGYLVMQNEPKCMADRILKLLADKKRDHSKLKRQSIASVQRFSAVTISARWAQILDP